MSTLNGIKNDWYKFEGWVHSWFPGFKTRFITGLGALGMFAASMQEYVSSLPLSEFVTTKTIALVSMGLLTLSYWFRGMGDRVAARVVIPSTNT